ncbi:MAG: hypothetical protein ACE37F_06615 [Nannocystaceae bacterium]|nr:hypothetical protein [bacterium]
MFGPDPKGLLKLIPRTVASLYRNCGSWSSSPIEGCGVDLYWQDVPDVFLTAEMSKVGFAGAFVSVLDLVKTRGRVRHVDTQDGGIEFRVLWT